MVTCDNSTPLKLVSMRFPHIPSKINSRLFLRNSFLRMINNFTEFADRAPLYSTTKTNAFYDYTLINMKSFYN